MQNDKNAGNYLYDKHYWGYICSPKFEGKTYKEMKDMLKDLLERCEMGEGRCRFKLEPPSRWEVGLVLTAVPRNYPECLLRN